jgi:hypothetical protein
MRNLEASVGTRRRALPDPVGKASLRPIPVLVRELHRSDYRLETLSTYCVVENLVDRQLMPAALSGLGPQLRNMNVISIIRDTRPARATLPTDLR